MTSVADLIPMQPAARPEAAAPKQTSANEDGVSFADVLETETAESDSSHDLTTTTPDVIVAAAQPAPAQPQATPAVNSAEAILAGLGSPVASDAADGVAGLQDDAVTPPARQGALPGSTQDAASAPPTAAQAPAASHADGEGDAAEDLESAMATPSADKKAATSDATTVSPSLAAPVATLATAPSAEAEPLSAPGAERAASSAETTPAASSKTHSAAPAADAGAKGPAGPSKTVQAATTSADPASNVKTEPAPTPVASTADTTAATRAPTSDGARAAQTHPALQNAPAATLQVYQRMVERFDGRAQRYEVRLDPAELGRVNVRIEVGADKKVHAVLAAHDSAALSDLMRGQRSLERALSDAGFDLADGGIQFELSSDQGQNSANQNGDGGNANVWRGFKTMDVAVDAQTAAAARPWRSSRLDLVA